MKVLIAEDEIISRRRLEKFLESMDYEVIACKDGLDVWKIIQSENAPNLLILDWLMPGMDGVEICRKVRKQAKEPYTFILLLSSKSEQEDIVRGMEAGADDYITKPFNKDELRVRLRAGRRIVELNEELLAVQNNLKKQVINDDLTGLYNRRYMAEILEKEFDRALRYETDLSCILLDLDYFKEVNDTFGHTFGDLVLCGISNCLRQGTRKTDISFRYGGEEFMILFPSTGIEDAKSVAEKIRSTCEAKIHDDGTNSVAITVSIGVASVKHHQPSDGKELIAFADKALYRAKAEGRNRVKVYESSDQFAGGKISKDKDFRYLKESLSSILEKTKRASTESLELLVRDFGGDEHKHHNWNVKRYIELVGERLALPPSIIETFKRAASFHDNFRILLRKSLENKSRVLNKEEKVEIEDHPYMLSELIELFDFFANEKSILLYHHENFDGTGYPEGLQGNEIPLGARIFAITDAIAAMLSERLHRKRLSPEGIVEELANNAGKQFDPKLVSLFFDIIEKQELLPVPVKILQKAREKVSEVR
ncbi:MAG: two-component response regulator [Candidatus Scalindua rubra]|uniref:diguanylate cyclase n=1 Tax=Candidatus Scalindua rubra TaxID=1872076 RepID=A0A1E3XBJ9_9BACT|nr:MAG: two-component response regulator [Candidatus Scalindua rubra]